MSGTFLCSLSAAGERGGGGREEGEDGRERGGRGAGREGEEGGERGGRGGEKRGEEGRRGEKREEDQHTQMLAYL